MDVIEKWAVVSSSAARKDLLVRMSRELELAISGTTVVPVSRDLLLNPVAT